MGRSSQAIKAINNLFGGKPQTLEICLAAVMEDWRALQYVYNQTPDIIEAALAQSHEATQFIKNKYNRVDGEIK